MAKEKTIKIDLTDRTEENETLHFNLYADNMERYEVIGILELAIFQLKQDCLKDTKELNSSS